MIGSPASRSAVASMGGAGRACRAAASAVSTVSAAIAASVTMAGDPQRRIATVDCAGANRFAMPLLRLKCLSALAVDRDRRPAYLTRPSTARPTRSRLLAISEVATPLVEVRLMGLGVAGRPKISGSTSARVAARPQLFSDQSAFKDRADQDRTKLGGSLIVQSGHSGAMRTPKHDDRSNPDKIAHRAHARERAHQFHSDRRPFLFFADNPVKNAIAGPRFPPTRHLSSVHVVL